MDALAQAGRLVGYARVSTDDQDLSLQLDALKSHGIAKDLIFTDKLSGAKDKRPGLSQCLKVLAPGDTLIVWRLDHLGRSMRHLVNLVEELRERDVGFRSISDPTIVLARKLHGDTKLTIDEICGSLHISRSTYYRYVARTGNSASP